MIGVVKYKCTKLVRKKEKERGKKMNEQEARVIERQLTKLLPGCKVEAYGSEEPDYQTKQFVSSWKVSVYSTPTKELGTIMCIICDQKHRDAFLSVCSSYYNQRKEIEENAEEADPYGPGYLSCEN